MEYFIFTVLLALSAGVPDKSPQPAAVIVQNSSLAQCVAARKETMKMLGAMKMSEPDLEKRITRCRYGKVKLEYADESKK